MVVGVCNRKHDRCACVCICVCACTLSTWTSLGETTALDLVGGLTAHEVWVQWETQDSQCGTGITSLFHSETCMGISGGGGPGHEQ